MMGHEVGVNVVAEGVETQAQLEYLLHHKCDKIQGYLFSKPLSESGIIQLLEYRSG